MKAKLYIGILTAVLLPGFLVQAQTDDSREYSNDYPGTIVNNYYDYDYFYASRINRFHRSFSTFNYYAPLFTDSYWYNYQPYSMGLSIYGGPGVGFGFFYNSPVYYDYGWNNPGFGGSYYGGYDPFYYNPWFSPIVINLGFRNRWSNYYSWNNHNRWDYDYRHNNNFYNNHYGRDNQYNNHSNNSNFTNRNESGNINQRVNNVSRREGSNYTLNDNKGIKRNGVVNSTNRRAVNSSNNTNSISNNQVNSRNSNVSTNERRSGNSSTVSLSNRRSVSMPLARSNNNTGQRAMVKAEPKSTRSVSSVKSTSSKSPSSSRSSGSKSSSKKGSRR
jgi:hypothetical protein